MAVAVDLRPYQQIPPFSPRYLPFNTNESRTQRLPFDQTFPQRSLSSPSSFLPLSTRIIRQISRAETELDRLMPNFWIQDRADELRRHIHETFNRPSLASFNNWLQNTGNGNWYSQLAISLAKLPLKAALNVVTTLVHLIEKTLSQTIYAVTHPLKLPLALAVELTLLVEQLTQPEVWTKIGASMAASNIGYATATANPISSLLLAIGGTMVLAGISFGALKAAIYAERNHRLEAAINNFGHQMTTLSEEMATGLCFGLLIGGIQQAIRGIHQAARNSSYNASLSKAQLDHATKKAVEFSQEYHLPAHDKLFYTDDSFKVYWGNTKSRVFNFPQNVPGADLLFDNILVRRIPVTELLYYDSRGIPIFTTRYVSVYENMIGYKIPMGAYPVPLRLPPVTMANISQSHVLPISVAMGLTEEE